MSKIAVAALSLGAAVAAFAPGVPAATPAATVKATDELKFAPTKITVSVGDTVRWNNASVLLHSVTDMPAKAISKDDAALPKGAKAFNSGLMDPKATYKHTFTRPGTYKYFCIPHEAAGMVGTVTVQPKK